MDLTLQSLPETRKQSLQSWVPIDFSRITCISKGFQDVTCCPINSKTKHTWMLVPLSWFHFRRVKFYFLFTFLYINPKGLFLHIYSTYFLFSGQQILIVMWRVSVLPSFEGFLLYLQMSFQVSSWCLHFLPLVMFSMTKKKYFGLGSISNSTF